MTEKEEEKENEFSEGCPQCGQWVCSCVEDDMFFEKGYGIKRSITARRIK